MAPNTKEHPVAVQAITPFLWFDNQAEEAAAFYVSIFPNSRIVKTVRCGNSGPGPAGSVLTVAFELQGLSFVALNGGPHFKFTEAVSFVVNCQTQEEVDTYWQKLSAGGQEVQCGWLKDKFGLSWQIVPTVLPELLSDPDPEKSARAMKAMMTMKKLDIGGLKRAGDMV
jgi:predicted 3-demethylubiquinone-9 3-methyltransferase (glyoxalase superfamily)